MGLLPVQRTLTFALGDKVPAAFLNELEDCVIGSKFPARPIFIPGSDWIIDSGAPTRAGIVWTFQTAVFNRLVATFRLWPGTRITNLIWSYNRNSNNVSGEFDFSLTRRSFGDGGATTASVTSGVVSSGTGWTTHDSVVDGGLPHLTLDGFLYSLSITGTTTFSGAPSFDGVKIICDRL